MRQEFAISSYSIRLDIELVLVLATVADHAFRWTSLLLSASYDRLLAVKVIIIVLSLYAMSYR